MNRVKEFIRLYKPFIIVLLETRISASAALNFAGRLGSQWKAETVASWGLSGGILFMWNSNEVDCHPRVRSRQIVHAAISVGNSEPWLISAIYAGQLTDDRKYLLQELSKISELDAPWLVVGDFNMITRAEEARGGKQFHVSKSVRIFRDFIASHDLVDLGFSGPSFTWCNNRCWVERIWRRIDRALATSSWLLRYPECRVDHLPRTGSDHAPLLVSLHQHTTRHARIFRFEHFWMEYATVQEIVASIFNEDSVHKLHNNLSKLQRDVLRWNKLSLGKLENISDMLKQEISMLEQSESDGTFTSQQVERLRSLYNHHAAIMRQIETKWRTKSRIRWLRDGDQNTHFFHMATLVRRRRNRITSLVLDNGIRISDEPNLMMAFSIFYTNLWDYNFNGFSADMDIEGFPTISSDVHDMLVAPFTIDEVKAALWSMPTGKAPGPDGYPVEFYRRYWENVAPTIMRELHSFQSTGLLPIEWARTFIVLIPKKENPERVSDYRPISLCNVCYRLLAKILVNRMKSLLPSLIGIEQSAFVPTRNISDNIMIVQEMFHSINTVRNGDAMMFIKCDMEKAYDRMAWQAILFAMHHMNFPKKMVNVD
uniref:Reverse transcriptase domain-containing protein n=1 Tax=Ananas comosus var. bracteatus TaxID=296719 RepID=A0A6V7PGS9_ANACO|nr:unnamed protein product [Ananas comosus var. bracteatus]